MYREYFGLKENPFSIAPDPHYFFMSEGHREALAHLVYGINSDGGFILLTGEVGTGKTTVCRCLLEQMPGNADIAFILNPKLTVDELLATICDEFGIAYAEGSTSNKVFISRIYDYLLENHGKGRRAILIVEEAQNLSVETLEQIRLLTNLETSERKLLQIIMLGQPELREMLLRQELRQISQRITARYHLGPLSKKEVPLYVKHRLEVAGLTRGKPFPDPVLTLLYRLTGGVPRLINVICDRALTGAFVQEKEQVDKRTLARAAREVSGDDGFRARGFRTYVMVVAASLILVVLTGGVVYYVKATGHTQRSLERPVPPQTIASVAPVIGTGGGAAAEIKPVTLEMPAGVARFDSRKMALQSLFKIWQITYDPSDSRPPCEQAESRGIRCLEDRGTLSSLRRLNKPAVLSLREGKDGEYHVLVTSLKHDKGAFVVGDETRIVDLKDLEAKWSGGYLLLWRAPPGYSGRLAPGSRGKMVTWLDRQLAVQGGRKVNPERQAVYDDEIEKQVKKFQTTVGLIPDGVAGAKTIICLTGLTGEGGPSLREKKGDN